MGSIKHKGLFARAFLTTFGRAAFFIVTSLVRRLHQPFRLTVGTRSMSSRINALGSFFILSIVAFTTCGKGNYETDLIIRPRIRISEGSAPEGEAAYQMRVYAWYITKDEKLNNLWEAASWEDADAGIITNIKTGERRSFEFLVEQPEIELAEGEELNDEDTYIHLALTRSFVFLVAVDPLNRFYAYRPLEMPKPMPWMRLTLMIRTWKEREKWLDWTVTSADYVAPATEDIK
jgi:hypothetical protein